MDIDKRIRFTRVKGQPHLHLYVSEEEYINLGKPKKIIDNLAQFLDLKITDKEINDFACAGFDKGIYYIKIEID